MFNDDYGLTQAVLDGRKTMTRRIIKCPRTFRGEWVAGFNVHIRQSDKKIVDYPCMYDADGREFDGGEILPKYKIGEVVAIAQSYKDAGNGAFIFEYANNATYSFSEYTSGLNMNLKDSVSYQTKNSYNGSVITVGTANDTDTLTLGIIREKDSRLLKGAIYYFALYNKSLTPEEIEEEKVKLENYWEGGKNELA
jgi:hypothetical protein